MTIRQKISDAFSAKTRAADPAALRQRIFAQENLVRDLEGQHAEASLQWASGASGSAAKLEELDGQFTIARRELRALQSALSLAQQQEAQAERQRLAALSAAQIRAVEQHFAARDKAAAELTTAIENAVSAYRRLVERSQKAHAACPLGMRWPVGSPWHVGELHCLVESELFRLGGDPALGAAKSFPGARCPDLRNLNQPQQLEPLADTLKRWGAHTLATFKGQPVPVQALEPPQLAPASQDDGGHPVLGAEEMALQSGTRSADEIMAQLQPVKLS